jgi:hypothetical protein
MIEADSTEGGRIAYAFEVATGQMPTAAEAEILLASLRYYLDIFRSDPAAATKFLKVAGVPDDRAVNSVEFAAYATVASMILNLDKTVTKE